MEIYKEQDGIMIRVSSEANPFFLPREVALDALRKNTVQVWGRNYRLFAEQEEQQRLALIKEIENH